MRNLLCAIVCSFLVPGANIAFAETAYDRDVVVLDTTRRAEVERAFKRLMQSYQDEDVGAFLEGVSEDRFQQDYVAFSDALYEDMRSYEIHRVDYWIDRVVGADGHYVLYARWNKRYEDLENARQLTAEGITRFAFDEINGQFMLVGLAGTDLWGASYAEWTEQTASIPEESALPPSSPQGSVGGIDLVPVGVSMVANGATHDAVVTVKNQGATASIPCDVSVQGGAIMGTPSGTLGALAAGASGTVTIPAGAAFTGPDTVTVVVDIDAQNAETDESNNTVAFPSIVGH